MSLESNETAASDSLSLDIGTILQIVGISLVAYIVIGFIWASLVAKFEIPTNHERFNARWCDSAGMFTMVWLGWPIMFLVITVEQTCVRLAKSGPAIEKYIAWLRGDKSKNTNITA